MVIQLPLERKAHFCDSGDITIAEEYINLQGEKKKGKKKRKKREILWRAKALRAQQLGSG